ncbi:Aste57867_17648 [Aphanomyces stellatus]|uniref:Aste57867_17648 protein n=1 Tax=Aphanomyces stellatus TaxID=120398 RepID=A0A485L8W0_9STRA|nr:hypothetical protein As57867_017587 [Aphanomyces stellatus]VFT94399.1 Aste57867_17648 [Aphanomyces stellatus]
MKFEDISAPVLLSPHGGSADGRSHIELLKSLYTYYVGSWATGVSAEDASGDGSNQTDITGHDWLCVEEYGGFIFTGPRLRRECIVVDQPQHLLRCNVSKQIMPLGNISMVIPIEDRSQDAAASTPPRWKVLLQDSKQYQEWAIHFPTEDHMQQWVSLLRTVMDATHCQGFIRDRVILSPSPVQL